VNWAALSLTVDVKKRNSDKPMNDVMLSVYRPT